MKVRQDNTPLALFTSFLVLVLGAVLWGLMYYFGIFSAWIAFIAVFCAGLCYSHFCKHKKALYYIWLIVWSIILNLVAMFLTLTIEVQIIEKCNFIDAIKDLPYYLDLAKKQIIIDVIFSVVFTVIGIIFVVINDKFNKKRAKVEKTVDEPKKGVTIEPVVIEAPQPVAVEEVKEVLAEDNPLRKIADFCHKKYVGFAKLDDPDHNETKVAFDAKFINKLDAKSKAEIVKYFEAKKYELAIERLAADMLKETLKK